MVSTKYKDVTLKFAQNAYLNQESYGHLYQYSIQNPDAFWSEQAKQFISWIKPWNKTMSGSFATHDVEWFTGGQLNACYNCLDRHLLLHSQRIAIYWEGNSPNESLSMTYAELHEKTCKFANVLKNLGVKKGDRVCIYLPMIPESIITMLACARIGAIHSVVFAGFSKEALKSRIIDAGCSVLITSDESYRGEKTIPLKEYSTEAIQDCPLVRHTIVVKRTGNPIQWDQKKDIWYHEAMENALRECPIEAMDASDPLFILYTSGSTGMPKGIVHTTGGYLVYAATTHHYVFDYHLRDIYWCTADIGWITGHTYGVYGPLLNSASIVLFEGVPQFPNFSRYWEIIDKYQVNIFYTSPTAIRALRHEGDTWVQKSKRRSLKLLGTVGEPINTEVWEWYYNVVGEKRCPIVDTWWQTETGGIMITPLPGATPLEPGNAAWPFLGILPEIVDEQGKPVPTHHYGKLIIKKPWPGLMNTVFGDKQRFIDNYFKEFPGHYFTGDGAYCDENGYYNITGRIDDVIKISGHRIGTGELESALLMHAAVSEAAVIGIPHEITGEAIYAFVTTKPNVETNEALKKALIKEVREQIGPIAKIETIQWAQGLPKTRSGKIMRRILRKIATGEHNNLGDISTLAEPSVVEYLIQNFRKSLKN